jgi:methylglyoxal synthase
MNSENYIVIIAHDSKKPDLVKFLKEREDWLWGRHLIATDLTASFVEDEAFKVPVTHVSAGRMGGYNELTQKVQEGRVSMVIFFRDPEIQQEHTADVNEFIKVCNVTNTPLATNPASAELLILGMIKMEASMKGKVK